MHFQIDYNEFLERLGAKQIKAESLTRDHSAVRYNSISGKRFFQSVIVDFGAQITNEDDVQLRIWVSPFKRSQVFIVSSDGVTRDMWGK